jgi:hypothetical protein
MADTPPDAADTTAAGKRGVPKWMWAAGVAVVLIVAWQVAQGVFVKSIDAPGGASISFYPPAEENAAAPAGLNSANVIEQSNGTGNKASIHGDHNRVQQSGTGNTATIGGN